MFRSRVFIAALTLSAAGCGGGNESGPTGPRTGGLIINISGIPTTAAQYTVSGPHGYSVSERTGVVLTGLEPGTYLISPVQVVYDSETYRPIPAVDTVQVTSATSPATALVNYFLTTGRLRVNITGLPSGIDPVVVVYGPSFASPDTLHASRTYNNLVPGNYNALALTVTQGTTTYGALPRNPYTVVVADTAPASVGMDYAPRTGQITIVTSPLNGGANPSLTLTGPFGFSKSITKADSQVFTGLPLGDYVLDGGDILGPTDNFHPLALPYTLTLNSDHLAASFGAVYAVTSVALSVQILGLPNGVSGHVRATGPNGFDTTFVSSGLRHFLSPGGYGFSIAPVSNNGVTLYPLDSSLSAYCEGSALPCGPTVTYAPFDMFIGGLYVTQATQTLSDSVPLIAGRDAVLRVFPMQNRRVFLQPDVRVRWYLNGSLVRTDTLRQPSTFLQPVLDESNMIFSWNLRVPGSLIRPGLSVLADVDPGNSYGETDRSNNAYPVTAVPLALDVRAIDSAHVSVIPIRVSCCGLLGIIGPLGAFTDFARKIYPLPGIAATEHALYSTSTVLPLVPDDANGAWETILSEIDAIRTVEGAPAGVMYYGVVPAVYSSGVAGIGFVGHPVAMGWDGSIKDEIFAHEIGHNWGRLHSPCGTGGGEDPHYPYSAALIGAYGMDVSTMTLIDHYQNYDIMSYCQPYWVSDYTYEGVMAFRASSGYDRVAAVSVAEPALLVWGRVVGGHLILEPAFEVVTRPQLPEGQGPYSIQGVDASGSPLFSYAFSGHEIADGQRGARGFVFAIPLSGFDASRLAGLRVAGVDQRVDVSAAIVAPQQTPSLLQARSAAGAHADLTWDAAAYPMALVRDATTGEVLSFARGGRVRVGSRSGVLDVTLSDGVHSVRERLRVQ